MRGHYHHIQEHRIWIWNIGMIVVVSFFLVQLWHGIPDVLVRQKGRIETELAVPVSFVPTHHRGAFEHLVGASADAKDPIFYEARLFGVIPLREVVVTNRESEQVYLGGGQIGIYARTKGILVAGLGKVLGDDEKEYIPAEGRLQAGDYLEAMNGITLREKEDVIRILEQYKTKQEDQAIYGRPITVKFRRSGKEQFTDLAAIHTKQGYRLGLWLRDDVAGLGTLTYVKKDHTFGALGHCVSDYDSADQLAIDKGKLYEIEIVDKVKGISGSPGELKGVIQYDTSNYLGEIWKNTSCGIYGQLRQFPQKMRQERIQVKTKQQIKNGPAKIVMYEGTKKQMYDILITSVDYHNKRQKDIQFQVVDQHLIDQTGGILQGMSGSPILQDDQLIGAVTHVLVDDPTRGYGIFIEEMLDN